MSTVSCSPSKIASRLLTGGGPNVAANVQAGKTNSQTVGVTKNVAPTVSLKPHSRVETVDQSSSTTNDTNPIVWIVFGLLIAVAMYLLYLLPSPKEKS